VKPLQTTYITQNVEIYRKFWISQDFTFFGKKPVFWEDATVVVFRIWLVSVHTGSCVPFVDLFNVYLA